MAETLRLTGIQVLDPALQPLAEAELKLSTGSQWPEGLQPQKLQLLPGLVDLNAHLGEPGPPHPATIGSELLAARRGGYSAVVLNPDTQPVIDHAAVIEWVERRAAAAGGARLRLLGALTQQLEGEALASMDSLRRSGVVGLSQGERWLPRTDVLLNALRYAAGLGLRVHLLAGEGRLQAGLTAQGPVATEFGLPGVPVAGETVALGKIIALVEETGCAVHIGRIATAAGVEWVRWAKSRGLNLSADVSLPHLLLTSEAQHEFNPYTRFTPPLYAEHDRLALIEGVSDGTIDAICAHHHPHPADAYQQPLADIPPGASAYDTFLPLLLGHPALTGLSQQRRLTACSTAPAGIVGLGDEWPDIGVIYDPDLRWEAGAENFASACFNSPWVGQPLQGRCRGVIIDGHVTIFTQCP